MSPTAVTHCPWTDIDSLTLTDLHSHTYNSSETVQTSQVILVLTIHTVPSQVLHNLKWHLYRSKTKEMWQTKAFPSEAIFVLYIFAKQVSEITSRPPNKTGNIINENTHALFVFFVEGCTLGFYLCFGTRLWGEICTLQQNTMSYSNKNQALVPLLCHTALKRTNKRKNRFRSWRKLLTVEDDRHRPGKYSGTISPADNDDAVWTFMTLK